MGILSLPSKRSKLVPGSEPTSLPPRQTDTVEQRLQLRCLQGTRTQETEASVGAPWACEKLLTVQVCSIQAAPQPSKPSPGGQEGPGSSGFLVFQ